jgi:hypothetical protein
MLAIVPSTDEWQLLEPAGAGLLMSGVYRLRVFLGEGCAFRNLHLWTAQSGRRRVAFSWLDGQTGRPWSRALLLPQGCVSVRYCGLSDGTLTLYAE